MPCPRVCASSPACPRCPVRPSPLPPNRSSPPRSQWFGARPPLCLGRQQILVPRRTLSRWRSNKLLRAAMLPHSLGVLRNLPFPCANTRTGTRRGCLLRGISAPALLFTATGIAQPCALWARPHNEMVGSSARLLRRRPRSGGARRHPMSEVHLAVRRRLAVLARLSRVWSVASVRRVMGSATMASSCSSSASSPRSSSSHPWLAVCTLHGPRVHPASRMLSTPAMHVVCMLAWPAMRPR